MFNIGGGEIIGLLIIGMILIGPDRMPNIAADAAKLLIKLKNIAQKATNDLKENLGPGYEDLQVKDLNPNAIELLTQNFDKINWMYLSQNENAIQLLTENPEKIDWTYLSLNSNAIELLKNNKNKIDNKFISNNPSYYQIFPERKEYDEERYIEYIITLRNLFGNIQNNEVYFNSEDCDDMELLENNQHKIKWDLLAKNPAIFSYDYDEIKNNFQELGEEIIQKALHPKRMLRLMAEYGEDIIYECYFD